LKPFELLRMKPEAMTIKIETKATMPEAQNIANIHGLPNTRRTDRDRDRDRSIVFLYYYQILIYVVQLYFLKV